MLLISTLPPNSYIGHPLWLPDSLSGWHLDVSWCYLSADCMTVSTCTLRVPLTPPLSPVSPSLPAMTTCKSYSGRALQSRWRLLSLVPYPGLPATQVCLPHTRRVCPLHPTSVTPALSAHLTHHLTPHNNAPPTGNNTFEFTSKPPSCPNGTLAALPTPSDLCSWAMVCR